MKKLYGVQYLRAAAALGVVVFHAAERTGHHFAIGAAGVDVFFVVSGFIMWVIADMRHPSPSAFLAERIERIVPTYWIASAVMVAGGLAGLFPNMRLTALHVLGSFAFIPHRSPSNGEIWPVLVQGWTLNYEVFFYTLFALCLLLPTRRRFAALAALFAGLVGLGLLLASDNAVLKTFTSPLLLEFLIGAAIGRMWLAGRIPTPAVGTALIAAASAGFALVGVTYAGFNAFVLGPLAAALLAGVLALEKGALVRHWRPLAYLGDSSYSVYLWHTMAISVVAKLGNAWALPGIVTFAFAVVLGLAIGVTCHEAFEKPIAKFLKFRRHQPAPAGAA
jgi:exopolysaccharide production protein ExoZ